MSDMDILEQLEKRVEDVLSRLAGLEADKTRLEQENAQLREESSSGRQELEEENQRLREELDKEKTTKEAVLNKIDGLLKKIADHTGS